MLAGKFAARLVGIDDGFGRRQGVAGQVVSWDLKRDLALVSIFTDMQIDPVRVGSVERTTKPGEPVVTVGCNGGADPTLHHSRITAVDKYLGPANVQVAGQPVQGRNGGGLFSIDGTLIGVCNAADPAENEGLFAALPSSPAAYVLARQMGGNAPMMAGIITVSTPAAMIAIPLVLALFG